MVVWSLRRFVGLVAFCASPPLFCFGCEDESRCSRDADCPKTLVCSNDHDRQGEGVCVDPCAKRVSFNGCAGSGGASAGAAGKSGGAGTGGGSGGSSGAGGAGGAAAGTSGAAGAAGQGGAS